MRDMDVPMAGQIKRMIETIVTKRANGNPTVATTTRTKLILKGINPDKFNALSADDAAVMAKLRAIAGELGVQI